MMAPAPTSATLPRWNLPNGDFVTVWYERPKDSPRAVLRKAQWSIV